MWLSSYFFKEEDKMENLSLPGQRIIGRKKLMGFFADVWILCDLDQNFVKIK